MAKKGDLSEASAALAQLEREMERFMPALEVWDIR